MNVCSLGFLSAIVIGSAVFFWLPGVRVRQFALAAANVAFLGSWIPNLNCWAVLAAFVGSGFVIARFLQVYPRRGLLAAYLLLLVGAFLVLKQYEFLRPVLPSKVFEHSIIVVGLSYMLFRQIHVAVDALQGQIERFTLWTYLNFQFNLFGILAGPIQRYQEFQQGWDRLEPVLSDTRAVLQAYLRIFVGVIKISVVALACLAAYNRLGDALLGELSQQPSWKVIAKLLMWFYLYPAYVYFNFSGYCDIVIGAGSLFGITMPENFDWPFLSRNMIEYWTRWHRTLGFWIRDYLFIPLYKAIAERNPRRAPSLAFACYFVALFITGIWHGSTWNFVIFGLLNGLGVSAAKLWETYLVKRRGRPGLRNYLQSNRIRVVAIIATFHYVCLTILFFPVDLERTLRIVTNCVAQLH